MVAAPRWIRISEILPIFRMGVPLGFGVVGKTLISGRFFREKEDHLEKSRALNDSQE